MKFTDLIAQHIENGNSFQTATQKLLSKTPGLYDVEVFNAIGDVSEFYNGLIGDLQAYGQTMQDRSDASGLRKSVEGMDKDSDVVTYIYVHFATAQIEYLREIIGEIDKLAKSCGSDDVHANDEYVGDDSNIRPGNEEDLGLPVWIFSSVYGFE